jgi:prephenate dehydrogenase
MSGDGHLFERVAILGLGLMGGSLGLALRAVGGASGAALKGRRTNGALKGGRAGVARVVAGYDAAPGVAERARARGAVDVACASVAEAVAGADLVVLAAPVLALRDLLRAIAPHLAPSAVVTDLGSTKAEVVGWAAESLPDPSCFVGGHPMAGSEWSGIEAADVDLYRACVWCLTPTPHTAPAALARVTALVKRIGARPLLLDAAAHDAAVAAISHLPLVAAAALTLAAAGRPEWPLARRLAAGGFRDTTRVASGDPHMARDICLTNTQPLVECLDAYLAALHDLRERIAAREPTVESVFAAAKGARDLWRADSKHAE